MCNFKSKENYDSLKKFFAPECCKLRQILVSNQLSHEHMKVVFKELEKEFSKDFFMCLEVARAQFMPNTILVVLHELYISLKAIYEPLDCFVIFAKQIDSRGELEVKLNEKFHKQYGKLNFVYEQDDSIIGGLIIKLDGKYYDGSFKNILFNIQSSVQEEIIK